MDINNSPEKKPANKSENITIPGRVRIDSDPSTSDDERTRLRNQQFMISGSGIVAASPPKFVTLDEIMQAAKGMSNMALVHQIAVDNEFKLKPVELPESSLEKRVSDTMKRAFWDLLRNELNEDPPNYTQALCLLENVKEGLYSILLSRHTKTKQEITEVLDLTLIKQQVDAGTLDFKHYASYVLSVMAKHCAPIRDDRVKELSEMTDIVETFRGILETLDLMALDLANFAIDLARPDIIAQSVQYERNKFADYLKIHPDGLAYTRLWLQRHLTPAVLNMQGPDSVTIIRNITKQVLSEAYFELLEWDNNNIVPETIVLDVERILDIKARLNKLVIAGSILLVVISAAVNLQGDSKFKSDVKDQIIILLQDVNVENEEELKNNLQNITDQMIKIINETSLLRNMPQLNPESVELLQSQINGIANPQHRIRHLVYIRVKEFLLEVISSTSPTTQKVPIGLSALQNELVTIAGNFLRLVSHNRAIFAQYYMDIIEEAIPASEPST